MLSEVAVRLLRRHVHGGRERAVPTGLGDILHQLLRVALYVGVARWHGIEGVLRSILAHLVVAQLRRALGSQAGHVVPRVLPLLAKLGVVLPLILRGLRPRLLLGVRNQQVIVLSRVDGVQMCVVGAAAELSLAIGVPREQLIINFRVFQVSALLSLAITIAEAVRL